MFFMGRPAERLSAKRGSETKPVPPVYKFLALFGRHLHPLSANRVYRHHPPVPRPDIAYQEAGKDKQACRLPVADRRQAKQSRHQPVPQQHNNCAKSRDNKQEANGR
jgi:hypothetical protein